MNARLIPIENQIVSPMAPLDNNPTIICPLMEFDTTLSRDIYLDINQNVSFSAFVIPRIGITSADANSNHIAVGLSNSTLVNLNVLFNQETVLPSSPKIRSRLKTFSIDTFGMTNPGVTDVRLAAGGLNLGCISGSKTSIVRAQCPPGRKLGIITPHANFSTSDPSSFSYFIPHYGSPNCDFGSGSSIFKDEQGKFSIVLPAGTYYDENGVTATNDKFVSYDCAGFGEPIPAFYSDAFRPILGVFQVGSNGTTPTGDEIDIASEQIASQQIEFLGLVDAEFVVWEVNHRSTFGYNATQKDVNCKHRAQVWPDFTLGSTSMQVCLPYTTWRKISH